MVYNMLQMKQAGDASSENEPLDSNEQLKRLDTLSRVILVDLVEALQNTPAEVTDYINDVLSLKNMFPPFPGEDPVTQIEELILNLNYFTEGVPVISAKDKPPKQSNLIVCNEIDTKEYDETYYFINGEIVLARRMNATNQYENIIVKREETADCVTYLLNINRNPQLGEPSTTLELTKMTTASGFESASFKPQSISSKIVQ
ncbi:MAG: hypothetical protein QG570_400 [Patescibacteria group bacterium]|nr:hypothetical protein [Patescibacteria group bacterium]